MLSGRKGDFGFKVSLFLSASIISSFYRNCPFVFQAYYIPPKKAVSDYNCTEFDTKSKYVYAKMKMRNGDFAFSWLRKMLSPQADINENSVRCFLGDP